jgi:hypothetical protein
MTHLNYETGGSAFCNREYVWRQQMSAEIIDLNLLLAGDPLSVPQRTLMADLKELPVQVAKSLLSEALQFSACRLCDFEFMDRFRFRLLFSLR